MTSPMPKLTMPRVLKKRFAAVSKWGAEGVSHPENSGSRPISRDLDVVEKLAALFEPDRLAPAQFFNNFRRKTLIEPERKLTLAIMEDAINCFQDNVLVETGKRKKLFEDTQEWFLSEDSDWIFSFRNVCELLAINPEYLRGGLMRWKEQKLANRYGLSASAAQGSLFESDR